MEIKILKLAHHFFFTSFNVLFVFVFMFFIFWVTVLKDSWLVLFDCFFTFQKVTSPLLGGCLIPH